MIVTIVAFIGKVRGGCGKMPRDSGMKAGIAPIIVVLFPCHVSTQPRSNVLRFFFLKKNIGRDRLVTCETM